MSRPMFQNRHYKAIAEVICTHDYDTDLAEYYALEKIAYKLAVMLAKDNQNFKRWQFLKACGF